MSAEAIIAIASIDVVLLLAMVGFMWRNLGAQIAAFKSDIEQQIAALRTDLSESKSDLSQSIATVKSDLETDPTATRRELTAAIDKQTDLIVALHRDLRGLGERVARVEANA